LTERRKKSLAITKTRKEELLGIYGDLLKQATGIVVTEYKAITVAQVNQLRDKLRDVQGVYAVTKNTLFLIALREAGWPAPENLFTGSTAVIFGAENFPQVAKAAIGFNKDFENFYAVKGGIMAGTVLNAAQVDAVSNLPSLDELRAQLAGLIVQPASGVVGVINSAVAAVPQVLQAYVSKHDAA
jgi:large subunit ribosomal protein L10